MTARPLMLAVLALPVALCTASPAAAQSEVNVDRNMLPYALSYAACVHGGTQSCAPLRASYEEQAEQTFRRFGPTDMIQKRERFTSLLDFLDRDAARMRAAGQGPSPALVAYMLCLGDAMQADPRFREGVAVDPNPALGKCVPERKAIPVRNLSTPEEKRSYRYLFNLEQIVNGTGSFARVRDGLLGRPMISPF